MTRIHACQRTDYNEYQQNVWSSGGREDYALVEARLVPLEVVHERARDDAVRQRPRSQRDADLGGDLCREDLEILELEAAWHK